MAIDYGKASSILNETFIENHKEVSEDEAANLIVRAEMKIRTLDEEMALDEELIAATQIVKMLKGAYTDATKYERAKIAHLLKKIDEIHAFEGENPEASHM